MSNHTAEQAQIIEAMARLTAIQANIEAMKAENTFREQRGMTIAYDEAAFANSTDEAERIANQMHTLAYRCIQNQGG